MFLAFFVRLAFEGGVREAVVVAACPLGPFLSALDFGGVDEAIALGPFGRAAVVLVVPYVLLPDVSTRSKIRTAEETYLDVEVVYVAWMSAHVC